MRRHLIFWTVFLILVGVAWAANNVPIATFGGTRTVFKTTDTAGVHVLHVNVDTAASGGSTTTLPTNAAATTTPVTVTNVSGTFLAAASAVKFLFIKNESTTASIALNFAGGTAVLNTAGNVTLGPGASISFDGTFVPSGAITAISSAATSPATIVLN